MGQNAGGILVNTLNKKGSFTGFELVLLLREYIDSRCDELEMQNPETWAQTIEMHDGTPEGMKHLMKMHEEIELRQNLRSLKHTKAFVEKVLAKRGQ